MPKTKMLLYVAETGWSLFHSLEEIHNSDLKRLSEQVKARQRYIHFSPLERPHLRTMKPTFVGEDVLSPSPLQPKRPNPRPQSLLDLPQLHQKKFGGTLLLRILLIRRVRKNQMKRRIIALPLLVLAVRMSIAQSNPANSQATLAALKSSWTPDLENCSANVGSFWDRGKQIQYRFCERLMISVMSDPFLTRPLAYTVGVVNFNDATIETDYTNWRLRSVKGQELPAVNPDRVAASLRKRASWAALFAGMGAGMNSRPYSATVTGPNGPSKIQGNIPADSSEINEARERAAAPLEGQAAEIQDGAFRRTSLFSLSNIVGSVFFESVKGGTGTLTYQLPSGKEADFTVQVRP